MKLQLHAFTHLPSFLRNLFLNQYFDDVSPYLLGKSYQLMCLGMSASLIPIVDRPHG